MFTRQTLKKLFPKAVPAIIGLTLIFTFAVCFAFFVYAKEKAGGISGPAESTKQGASNFDIMVSDDGFISNQYGVQANHRHYAYDKDQHKYNSNHEGQSQYDYVTVSRWVDPERDRPLNYRESKQPTGIFNNNLISASAPRDRVDNLVYLIVDETLYDQGLDDEITVFISDLENDGYNVELYTGVYGNPEELKSFLQAGYPDLIGAIFIGDIQTAWYEHEFGGLIQEFPMDLFYMDLDGIWIDSDNDGLYDEHAGNVEPEIWTGRIDASTLYGTNVSLYENYFRKNHDYRTGALKLPNRALVYVDDDWAGDLDHSPWEDNHRLLYDYTTYVGHLDGTSGTDYKNRLKWDYDWITVFAHSSSAAHSFVSLYVSNYLALSRVTSNDIESIDPNGLFYNLFACSSG